MTAASCGYGTWWRARANRSSSRANQGQIASLFGHVAPGTRAAVSKSPSSLIKVWAIGAAAPWTCERTLLGHTRAALSESLAGWRDKVLSGSGDVSICVWDVRAGAHDATLVGHTGWGSWGLRCTGLPGSSIRVWALLGTWAPGAADGGRFGGGLTGNQSQATVGRAPAARWQADRAGSIAHPPCLAR